MKKIYVRFGEIIDPTNTEVYEAIIENNTVKILMPKSSHPAAIDFAKAVGFGDVPTYVVEGRFEGTDDRSISTLSNPHIIKELSYDTLTETYQWVNDEIPRTPQEKIYDEIGFWKYLKYSLMANFRL